VHFAFWHIFGVFFNSIFFCNISVIILITHVFMCIHTHTHMMLSKVCCGMYFECSLTTYCFIIFHRPHSTRVFVCVHAHKMLCILRCGIHFECFVTTYCFRIFPLSLLSRMCLYVYTHAICRVLCVVPYLCSVFLTVYYFIIFLFSYTLPLCLKKGS